MATKQSDEYKNQNPAQGSIPKPSRREKAASGKGSASRGKKAAGVADNSNQASNARKYVAAIAAIIILIIFAGAIVYDLNSQPAAPAVSLSTFENSFNSANAIGVYATYTTNQSYGPTVECSVLLTEEIAGNSQIHKKYDQIHYFIINQTACTSSTLGPNATTSVGSIANCTAFSATHPSIFVNYSRFTKTVITKDYLYFYGNATTMPLCGITSQLS